MVDKSLQVMGIEQGDDLLTLGKEKGALRYQVLEVLAQPHRIRSHGKRWGSYALKACKYPGQVLRFLKVCEFEENVEKLNSHEKKRSAHRRLITEASFQMDSPFLERVFGHSEGYLVRGEERSHVMILETQYLEGTDLWEYIPAHNDLTEDKKLKMIYEFLLGIQYFMKSVSGPDTYVHRDLSPRNEMIDKDSGRLIIVDFDWAHIAYNPRSSFLEDDTICGTPGYASPEAYVNKTKQNQWYYDLYTAGRVISFILYGIHYYDGENRNNYYYNDDAWNTQNGKTMFCDFGFGFSPEWMLEQYKKVLNNGDYDVLKASVDHYNQEEYKPLRSIINRMTAPPSKDCCMKDNWVAPYEERFKNIDDIIFEYEKFLKQLGGNRWKKIMEEPFIFQKQYDYVEYEVYVEIDGRGKTAVIYRNGSIDITINGRLPLMNVIDLNGNLSFVPYYPVKRIDGMAGYGIDPDASLEFKMPRGQVLSVKIEID